MILLAAVDLEGAIHLLVKQEAHHLMREGHGGKGKAKVGSLSHDFRKPEGAADEERDVAFARERERGDLILKVDDTETNTVAELRAVVADHKVGDQVKILVERNGKQETLMATLKEMPQSNR